MVKRKTEGQPIIEYLNKQGVERVFWVPCERNLAVVEGLYHPNKIIKMSQEGAVVQAWWF